MTTRYALKHQDGRYVSGLFNNGMMISYVLDEAFALTWPSATEAVLEALKLCLDMTWQAVAR